ncbi:MAG: hypothetical protein V1797_13520 [Pseudomonadota bacterium]
MNISIESIVGYLIGFVGILISVRQTIRLKQLEKFRDTELRKIWKKVKNLSGELLVNKELDNKACGKLSQGIEDDVASVIFSLSKWNRNDIEELYVRGQIDDHDRYTLIRLLTK